MTTAPTQDEVERLALDADVSRAAARRCLAALRPSYAAPVVTPERVTLLTDALRQAANGRPSGRFLSWEAMAERLLATPAMRALLDPPAPEPHDEAAADAAEWLTRLDNLPAAERRRAAAALIASLDRAQRCFEQNHDGRLTAAELAPEWTDEYRVAGMPFRTSGGRECAENSHALTAPDPFTHDEALALMRDLQGFRGGTVEHRRIAVTAWEPVPADDAQGPTE